MSNRLPDEGLEPIRAAVRAGRKIEAIKLYREATGAGLVEAKRFVEALEAGHDPRVAAADRMSDDHIAQIQAAIFAGQKIPAIKLYRQATGEGLREAKEFIEALEAELRQTDPTKFTAPPTKGCGVTVLCALLVVALLFFAIAS